MANKFAVKTSFHPYRMVIKRKEKVEMIVEITNISEEEKMTSLTVQTPKGLSLNETLNVNSLEKRLGVLKPKQTARIFFNIHPRFDTPPGPKEISLKLTEHHKSYDFVSDQFDSKIILKTE